MNYYDRQGNLFPYNGELVAIFGVGNVGSYTALLLAKMGVNNMEIYDDDIVEDVNLSTQLYGVNNIEQKKTAAMSMLLAQLAGVDVDVYSVSRQWLSDADIVILAIDSLEGRIRAINQTKAKNPVYFDARQGALSIEVYSGDADYLLENLENTKIVEASECSAKGIAFNSVVTAGLIANEVRRYLASGHCFNQFVRLDLDNLALYKSKLWASKLTFCA